MYLEFAMLQGCYSHSQHALRPLNQKELEERQIAQAASMQGMPQNELARRYGQGLENAYAPLVAHQSSEKQP